MRRVHSTLFVRNHDYLPGEVAGANETFVDDEEVYLFWKKNQKDVVQVGNFQLCFKVI